MQAGRGVVVGGKVTPRGRQSAKLFLQSSELGLPQPLTHRRVCPPPHLVPGGGAHSLAREGVGESQVRRGDIHCGTLRNIYFVRYTKDSFALSTFTAYTLHPFQPSSFHQLIYAKRQMLIIGDYSLHFFTLVGKGGGGRRDRRGHSVQGGVNRSKFFM